MEKHVYKVQIIGAAALLNAGFIGGGAKPKGAVHEDPQGCFTMEVNPSWEEIAMDGTSVQFSSAVPTMQVYLLALDAETVDEGCAQTFAAPGFDPGLLQSGGFAIFGDWEAYTNTITAGMARLNDPAGVDRLSQSIGPGVAGGVTSRGP